MVHRDVPSDTARVEKELGINEGTIGNGVNAYRS